MRIVVFDLDGTLYQTRISLIQAFRSTLCELGLPPVDEDELCRHLGSTTETILKAVLPEGSDFAQFQFVLKGYEKQAIHSIGLLFPGTKEMLSALIKKGYTLTICSNGGEEHIRDVLKATGIESFFDGIRSAKNYRSKGDAVKSLLSAGDEAVLIGDTHYDFEAAKANQIPSIAAAYGYGMEPDLREATFSVSSAEGIIGAVIQIEVYREIADRLLDQKRCRIIGINGVDTAGKTEFTARFSRYLEAVGHRNTVLTIDDFHNHSDVRKMGPDEITAYEQNAFDYRKIIQEVLEPLTEHGSLDTVVTCLNLETDMYEKKMHLIIHPDNTLLLEGVLLFREPLKKYFEGKIFLYIPFDEVLSRARDRDLPRFGDDVIDKYRRKYIPVQKRYLQEWNPMRTSDMVVDNQLFEAPFIMNSEQINQACSRMIDQPDLGEQFAEC